MLLLSALAQLRIVAALQEHSDLCLVCHLGDVLALEVLCEWEMVIEASLFVLEGTDDDKHRLELVLEVTEIVDGSHHPVWEEIENVDDRFDEVGQYLDDGCRPKGLDEMT